MIYTAWGPLISLGVSKAGVQSVNWCRYSSESAARHCLSWRRLPRLVEMSSACLCSGLTSPLRGNKARAHAEPVWVGSDLRPCLVSK